jgi:hypothetical protein
MVFGPLADKEGIGFSFAVHVLPIIIFFAALMSVMYHLRIMEWVVKLVGGALHRIIGTGAIESMNAAANIFVGQTEAPLVVRPYLKNLTEAQFFAVMVSGLASIAGTVLAGYVLMGAEIKYLLAAAFMAAPGGLLMAKLIMPDTGAQPSQERHSCGRFWHYRRPAPCCQHRRHACRICRFNSIVQWPRWLGFQSRRHRWRHDAVDTWQDIPATHVSAECAVGRGRSGRRVIWRKTDSQ